MTGPRRPPPTPPTPRPAYTGYGFLVLVLLVCCGGALINQKTHWVDLGAWAKEHAPAAPAAPAGPKPNGHLEKLVAAMEQLDDDHVPYCFGGGHGVTPARPTPPPRGYYCWGGSPLRKMYNSSDKGLDCSSSVSLVLQAAGYDLSTMTTQGFAGWGERGKGKTVTIWVRPGSDDEVGHVYLQVGDRFWGTSQENPRHGPGWHSRRSGAGFTPRHPADL